jgi:uncharacterized protein YjiK
MNKVLTVMILSCLSISCIVTEKKEDKKSKIEENMPLDYEVFPMPKELSEISGITFINDSLVAAIEDENGVIYFYDLAKKEVSRKIDFAKADDYEDLVLVNDDIYVVAANGTLFKIADFKAEKPIISKFKTELNEENNIESLAYDASNGTLLLVVKDKNLEKDKKQKDIYSFSIQTQKLNTKAAYSIKLKDIEDKFKGNAIEETSKKFLKIVGNQNLNDIIRPSAMTIHPINGDLYVLSAINKIIIVLSKENVLKAVIPFKGKDFIQPEGIAFNSKGELFISNEGKNKQANIIKLNQIEAK